MTPTAVTKLNLEQVGRAIVLCFAANLPVAVWGAVGLGKSSIFKQVSDGLKWKLYDIRLSDKEPGDFSIPFPNKDQTRVSYLASDLLPFGSNENCVILFDEYDRAGLSVQNVSIQLVLDRTLNGHKLSPNARIAIAGNGVTDVGTSPLSAAAATRMVHLYVEGESEGALESYLNWATANGVSAAMRSFARYRKDVWGASNGEAEVEQLARPSKRTFDMADKLMTMADGVNFETRDIMRAVVEGCVGGAAATELLAWKKLCSEAPTVEDVIAGPDTVKLPVNLGIYYALTMTLTDYVGTPKTAKAAELIAQYGLRWPEEQAAFLFKRLVEKAPSVVTGKSWKAWQAKRKSV